MHREFRAQLLGKGGLRDKTTNVFRLGGNLIDRFKIGIVEYGCGRRDDLIAAAKDAFFNLAAAIDIPLVPAIAETQIEQNLWDNYIEPTLQGIAAKVCGPKAGPDLPASPDNES